MVALALLFAGVITAAVIAMLDTPADQGTESQQADVLSGPAAQMAVDQPSVPSTETTQPISNPADTNLAPTVAPTNSPSSTIPPINAPSSSSPNP